MVGMYIACFQHQFPSFGPSLNLSVQSPALEQQDIPNQRPTLIPPCHHRRKDALFRPRNIPHRHSQHRPRRHSLHNQRLSSPDLPDPDPLNTSLDQPDPSRKRHVLGTTGRHRQFARRDKDTRLLLCHDAKADLGIQRHDERRAGVLVDQRCRWRCLCWTGIRGHDE